MSFRFAQPRQRRSFGRKPLGAPQQEHRAENQQESMKEMATEWAKEEAVMGGAEMGLRAADAVVPGAGAAADALDTFGDAKDAVDVAKMGAKAGEKLGSKPGPQQGSMAMQGQEMPMPHEQQDHAPQHAAPDRNGFAATRKRQSFGRRAKLG